MAFSWDSLLLPFEQQLITCCPSTYFDVIYKFETYKAKLYNLNLVYKI